MKCINGYQQHQDVQFYKTIQMLCCFICTDDYPAAYRKAKLAEDSSNIDTQTSDIEKTKSREKRKHKIANDLPKMPDGIVLPLQIFDQASRCEKMLCRSPSDKQQLVKIKQDLLQ